MIVELDYRECNNFYVTAQQLTLFELHGSNTNFLCSIEGNTVLLRSCNQGDNNWLLILRCTWMMCYLFHLLNVILVLV